MSQDALVCSQSLPVIAAIAFLYQQLDFAPLSYLSHFC